MDIILSGLGSALIATLISIWLQYWFDLVKSRKSVILKVVAWMDIITTRLQALSSYKLIQSQSQEILPTSSEYNAMSNELRIAILSNLIITEVRCAYDDSEITNRIIKIHGELTNAARLFWSTSPTQWKATNDQLLKIFAEKIEPETNDLMREFFKTIQLRNMATHFFKLFKST